MSRTRFVNLLRRIKAKVERPVADAAGDRRAEAVALIESSTGDPPDAQAIDQVEEIVREEHGDVRPRAET